jgi:phage terminase small subunit
MPGAKSVRKSAAASGKGRYGTSKYPGLDIHEATAVDVYVRGGNASAAGRAAGYSEGTAKRALWLERPEVVNAIKKARLEIQEKLNLQPENLLRETARIAFLDIRKAFDQSGNLLPIQSIEDQTAAGIISIEVTANNDGSAVTKVRFADKLNALDKLMRHRGLFAKDNQQSAGSLGEALREFAAEIHKGTSRFVPPGTDNKG